MFRWRPFLGPFHSLVLHYPIGFLTMAFLLEIRSLRDVSVERRRITRLVIWLSLLSGLASAGLGILRAGGGGYDPKAVSLHRWFGLSIPVSTLMALFAQSVSFRTPGHRGWLWTYRGLLTVTLGLLVTGSHLGGNLTHGSHYLTQHAPPFVKTLLEEDSEGLSPEAHPSPSPASGTAASAHEALRSKCIRCHGPEKQKGNYRLDQAESARRGGESGKAAIKPGDPFSSELVRLIFLPRSHEDAMPPEGKEALTPDEIATVIRWIQEGAIFPDDPPYDKK